MLGFDLILGMDWLSMFPAMIDYFKRRVQVCTLEGEYFDFYGERREPLEPYLCRSREQEYVYCLLVSLTLDKDFSTRGELPLVVCDFPDVFLEELPGLLPEKKIKFTIDLLSATSPISMTPYHFAPAKLRELNTQLQELQNLGFICLSTSPWRAPTFLAQKKDGSLRLCIDYQNKIMLPLRISTPCLELMTCLTNFGT